MKTRHESTIVHQAVYRRSIRMSESRVQRFHAEQERKLKEAIDASLNGWFHDGRLMKIGPYLSVEECP